MLRAFKWAIAGTCKWLDGFSCTENVPWEHQVLRYIKTFQHRCLQWLVWKLLISWEGIWPSDFLSFHLRSSLKVFLLTWDLNCCFLCTTQSPMSFLKVQPIKMLNWWLPVNFESENFLVRSQLFGALVQEYMPFFVTKVNYPTSNPHNKPSLVLLIEKGG